MHFSMHIFNMGHNSRIDIFFLVILLYTYGLKNSFFFPSKFQHFTFILYAKHWDDTFDFFIDL